jgi:3-methyladenine DNA glycosylase AlkD
MESVRELFESYRRHADPTVAGKMAAYMKNRFPFLGLPKPLRAELSREFLRAKANEENIDWNFVEECYAQPEREFQYLALEYLLKAAKRLRKKDIHRLGDLVVCKSWWESTDTLDELVGHLCLEYPDLKETVVARWIESGNIWLKRVAIDFQLRFKERTDKEFLSRAILGSVGTKEFFLNKSIGWALREYAKTDHAWVKAFLADHEELSPLSVKEARKNLE